MAQSTELSKQIYDRFRELKDFSFKDQICRASVSISNNIAEYFERQSNKELKQFFYIAKGSTGELCSMLYLALKLKHINENTFQELHTHQSIDAVKLLSGFIKSIK